MFTRKPIIDEPTTLDKVIDQITAKMLTTDPNSDEYAKLADQLVKIHALKPEKPKGVSPDTKATIMANIAGIVLIVGHERAHVITTKAFSLIMKAK